MDDNSSGSALGIYLAMAAVGLIESYKIGAPWYVGFGIGMLFAFVATFGIFPMVGQLAYYIFGTWIMHSVGYWFIWTFYFGLVLSILYSFVGILIMMYLIYSS